MTAALLERRVTETGGCRYPAWCNGSCQYLQHLPSGEKNHWSDQWRVVNHEFWDEAVGVELYGYENHDGVDQVMVCIAISDEAVDISSASFPADAARKLGNILSGIRATAFPYNNALLWHHDLGTRLGPRVHVEFRQPRHLRRGGETPPMVEVAIRDGENCAVDRVQVDLPTARKLGRLLVEAADRADKSNREFGLVA